MDQKIISFDLGTGGNKASLYDAEGNRPSSAIVSYQTAHPQVGWREQCQVEWWNVVVEDPRWLILSSGVKKGDNVYQRRSRGPRHPNPKRYSEPGMTTLPIDISGEGQYNYL